MRIFMGRELNAINIHDHERDSEENLYQKIIDIIYVLPRNATILWVLVYISFAFFPPRSLSHPENLINFLFIIFKGWRSVIFYENIFPGRKKSVAIAASILHDDIEITTLVPWILCWRIF